MWDKEGVSHTGGVHPSRPAKIPHPLLSEGCFCWVIDAKVLLIRKNETSNNLTEVDRLGGGVCG